MANHSGALPGQQDLPPTAEEQAREGLVPVAAEDPADLEEAAVERELRDGARGEPEDGAKPSGWIDPRAEIARKFNANRDAILDGTFAAVEDFEDAEYTEDQPEGEVPETAAPPTAPPDEDLDRLVPVQLGGRTVHMRQRDVIGLAEEGFTRRVQPDQGSRQVATVPQPAERREVVPYTGRPDPAGLVGLADRLLSGTTEEAAEVLADLVEQARTPAPNQADISQAVRTSMMEESLHNEATQAVAVAGRDFPDIVNDKYRAPLMLHITVGEFLDSMQKIGVSDDLLANLQKSGPYYVREAYKKLRMDPYWGRRLPTFVDIATAAGHLTRKAFNLPAPRPEGQRAIGVDVSGRVARKAALPALPRPSPHQGAPRASAQPRVDPEALRNRNAIKGMRLARGQAVA